MNTYKNSKLFLDLIYILHFQSEGIIFSFRDVLSELLLNK